MLFVLAKNGALILASTPCSCLLVLVFVGVGWAEAATHSGIVSLFEVV